MDITCRYYRNSLPFVDDIVMVRIGNCNEFGYDVTLLEYNNVGGFLSMQKLKKRKKVLDTNDIIPMYVIKVDEDKNFIDISRKKLNESETKDFMIKYNYSSGLNKIAKEIYLLYKDYCRKNGINNECSFEDVMEHIVWNYIDQDQTYEQLFNLFLQNPQTHLGTLFPLEFIEQCVANLKKRIQIKNLIQEAEINLVCFHRDSLLIIKELLTINNENEQDGCKCKIQPISPPTYRIKVEGNSFEKTHQKLTKVIDEIKTKSLKYYCTFSVSKDIHLVKQNIIGLKFINDFELKKLNS